MAIDFTLSPDVEDVRVRVRDFLRENVSKREAEVSYAKHYVANTLWRVIDRAVQVHGALGYSKDTRLSGMLAQARWARLADGADEVHMMRVAQLLLRAYSETGSTHTATGELPV